MLLDELRLNKNRIEALARQYGARHIRVFGSVARREERPDSNVDFLVDFPRGYDLVHPAYAACPRTGEAAAPKGGAGARA